jgi:hypothetical protein
MQSVKSLRGIELKEYDDVVGLVRLLRKIGYLKDFVPSTNLRPEDFGLNHTIWVAAMARRGLGFNPPPIERLKNFQLVKERLEKEVFCNYDLGRLGQSQDHS